MLQFADRIWVPKFTKSFENQFHVKSISQKNYWILIFFFRSPSPNCNSISGSISVANKPGSRSSSSSVQKSNSSSGATNDYLEFSAKPISEISRDEQEMGANLFDESVNSVDVITNMVRIVYSLTECFNWKLSKANDCKTENIHLWP